MFTGRNYPLHQTLGWTKKYILIFIVISSIPVSIYYFTEYGNLIILPWLPISLIGIAVAFYLGFKNNASYDRLWEARKIWGSIINTSRTSGAMVKAYVRANFTVNNEIVSIHTRLIKRHIAWLQALRFQLRSSREWEHTIRGPENPKHIPTTEEKKGNMTETLGNYLSKEEVVAVMNKQNPATHILDLQMNELTELRKLNLIDDFRHMEFGNLIKELYDHQGKCERIKNFPFPRQYASLNVYFVWIFIALLPFGLIQEFASIGEQYVWFTIPFAVLISWVFHTMELIGDYSENPFEGLNNDVPVTAMVRTIEIDLLEMLNEENIPKPITPTNKILM